MHETVRIVCDGSCPCSHRRGGGERLADSSEHKKSGKSRAVQHVQEAARAAVWKCYCSGHTEQLSFILPDEYEGNRNVVAASCSVREDPAREEFA